MRRRLPVQIVAAALNVLFNLSAVTTVSRSQSIDDRLWGTDGTVSALAKSGSTLYLGGNFLGVRPDRSYGWSRWNLSTDELVLPIPSTSELQANEIESDGIGGWYLGGEFRKIGGLPRTGLARVLADGTVASFNVVLLSSGGGPGTVDHMRRVGGILYFSGSFTHVNGVSRPWVAAVNANTGALLPWAPPVLGRVQAIETGPGKVYLSGGAGVLGGSGSIGAVDAVTGAVVGPIFPIVKVNPFVTDLVDVLKRFGNTLYIGGPFDTIATARRHKVAALDLTTGALLPWDPGIAAPSFRPLEIEASASAVYIGGYRVKPFSPFQFVPAFEARNTTTGATFGFVAPDFDTTGAHPGSVNGLRLSGSTLYLGGGQHVFGPPYVMPTISHLDAATGALTETYSPTSGWVYEIEVDGTTVAFTGILHDGIQPTIMPDLAALNITTGMPPVPAPLFDYAESVEQIQLLGSNLFTNQPGAILSRDAASGTYNASFYPLGPVHSLVSDGLSLYAGGDWVGGGTTRGFVTKIDPVTMLEDWSVSDFDGVVTALAFANSKLYVAGSFLHVLGEFRELGAALAPDGTLDPDWQPGYTLAPRLLVADGSGVYAAFPGNPPIASDKDYGFALLWEPNVSGEVYAMALSASRVYLGGLITSVNFNPAGNLAAVNKTDGQSVTWKVSANGQVNALMYDGTDVYIGGDFQSVTVTGPAPGRDGFTVLAGGTATAPSIVRIMEEDLAVAVGEPVKAPAGALEFASPFPNPAIDHVRLRWSLARATTMCLDLFDLGGRRVRQVIPSQMMAAGPHEIEIPLAGLGAGLYFARLAGAAGEAATRTVTVMR